MLQEKTKETVLEHEGFGDQSKARPMTKCSESSE